MGSTTVRVILGATMMAMLTIVAACTSDDSGSTATTTRPGPAAEREPTSVLTSLSAGGGTWGAPTAGGTQVLTLTTADAHVVVFADRPSRQAGVISTADFVASWNEAFADDPPNAVVVEHEPSGDADSTVVTLSDPEFDAASGSLAFTATVLEDEDHPESLAGIGSERHGDPPPTFGAASLFIDGADPYDVNSNCFHQCSGIGD